MSTTNKRICIATRYSLWFAMVLAWTGLNAQTITITTVNGINVPPDELYLPEALLPVFTVEWEASASATVVSVRVDDQTVFCDGDCSGTDGFFDLDQDSFPGCRHTLQLVGTFVPGGTKFSQTVAWWSTALKDCVGPPKPCEDGAGEVGRPVDVATGNMYHEMTDLSVQDPLPLIFVRRYDSRSTLDVGLGYGWRHSYQMRIQSGGTGRTIFVDRSGRQIYFSQARNSSGSAIWDENRIEHLTLTQGTPPWRVTDKHQTRYDFDSSGRLTSIQDRNGNALTFGYTGGNLTSIADSFGRSATLGYNGSNRLGTLTAGSRTVTYTYTGDNLTRVDLPDGSFVTYEYNGSDPHNMTAAKDALGQVIEAHSYYASDKVQTTQADGGNYLNTLVYNTATQTTVTNSRGVAAVYTHSTFSGLVTSSNGPGCTSCGGGGTTTTLAYDNFLNVKDRTDGRGVVTHMTYDGKGNVLTRTEAMGTPRQRTWTYTYDPTFNFPATITIPTVGSGACLAAHPNKVVTNTFRTTPAPNGDLMEQKIEGCEGAVFFTNITSYDYDSHGQIATVNGPRTDVSDVTTYTYYADNDADLNKCARLQEVANSLGHQTTHDDYDLFGNVGSVTDPNNVETTLAYDEKDRVTEVRLKGAMVAEDIVTENVYDTPGNLDFVRFPNCVETGVGCAFSLDYVYDTVNRLKAIHDAVGNKIIYTYDTEGNRTREEYQDSGAVVHRFANFAYDNFNRLQYVYFNAIVPENPGSVFSKHTYFNDGTLQAERDPEGHITTLDYDELKRLKTVTQTVGASNLVTTYGYDVQDNLNSVSAPNSPAVPATTYTSSDMGWRLTVSSPDTGTRAHSYDPAGNMLSVLDANGVTESRTYDVLNRPSTVTYPDVSLNVAYTYDSLLVSFGKGRRTGMTDPSGASTYHYDRRGFLVKEGKTIGSRTLTTQYGYDKGGNLTQVLYPTESALLRQGEANYTYDAADRVSLVTTKVNGTVTTVASTVSYKPFGPRTGLTFGNSLVDTRSYGTRYQLATWTVGSILNYTHSFNNDLNLASRTDNLNAGNNRGFAYDEIHRLKQATGPWASGTTCLPGNVTYTYDLNGNRQCKGEDSTATSYVHTAGTNRLASSSGGETASYSYDNDGNITADGTHTYQYSQANRLKTVDSGATATYSYDGDGRRVIKTTGTTTNYFYDPAGRLLTEMVPASGTGTDYLYLGNDPLARLDWVVSETNLAGDPLRVNKASPNVRLDWTLFPAASNQYLVRRKQVVNPNDKTFNGSSVIATVSDPTRMYDDPVLNDGSRYDYKVFRKTSNEVPFFFHTDHLGTPFALTDATSVLVWQAEHRPFGGIHSLPVSTVTSNLRFPGQYFDGESGRTYNLFRDHGSSEGRYLEPDPLGFAGGPNVYAYALNNPTLFADPSGLKVNLRCRSVGPPDGSPDAVSTWFARGAGAKHCFVESTCPKGGIPPTLVSYLAGVQVVEDWQHSAQVNNDVLYSRLGRFDQYAVTPSSPNCNCEIESCILKKGKQLAALGFRIENYNAVGPNSNSFALRLARQCGGELSVPVGNIGQSGAYGIESPWNINLP